MAQKRPKQTDEFKRLFENIDSLSDESAKVLSNFLDILIKKTESLLENKGHQKPSLLEYYEQLSKTDQKRLLEKVKARMATGESLFDSSPEFELKFANFDKNDRISTARYNLWQAESILWIVQVFTNSAGLGFDSFNKDRAFESISFLSEIAISTLSSCNEQIDCIETDLIKFSEKLEVE